MLLVSAASTVTLPSAVNIQTGMQCSPINTIKKTFSGGAVVVSAAPGQAIDGGPTYTLTNQFQYVTVLCDGANWLIVGKN